MMKAIAATIAPDGQAPLREPVHPAHSRRAIVTANR